MICKEAVDKRPLFFNLKYGDNKTFYSPKYTAVTRYSAKPDFRSTIYWNPNALTNEAGLASFVSFSADKKEVTPSGLRVQTWQVISVTKP